MIFSAVVFFATPVKLIALKTYPQPLGIVNQAQEGSLLIPSRKALSTKVVQYVRVILVFLHIVALHTVGSNNPDGVEIKKNKDKNGIPKDGIPFHPYYSVKDIVGVVVFLMIFSAVVFFAPAMNGYFLEHANFIEANPLKTPEHIAPLWYLTPFYSVLRAEVTVHCWCKEHYCRENHQEYHHTNDVFNAGAGDDTIIINASNITALEQTGTGNRARVDGGGGLGCRYLHQQQRFHLCWLQYW
jgi:hypothetical protein